ncbi:multicopper oxidase family protein [Streptosporangium sp. NPDC087985]|uniref:multicopper oxidase family protein n=1 Tax=Streptosporangium sp. NPDC087985 TaxID=3366196 RepID=UPI00382D799A
MTVNQLIVLDLLAAVLTAASWLGAGVAGAARRPRTALALLAAALPLSLARAGVAFALAGSGWWFAQEKITLALPLLAVTGVAATVSAGPRLVAAARRGGQADLAGRPAVVVPLLGAGYAAAAGLVVTLLFGYPATWSTGLVTVALVGAAMLVTWRIVSAPAPVPGARAVTAATLVVGLAGVGLAFVPVAEFDAGGGPAIGQPAEDGHVTGDHQAGGHAAGGAGGHGVAEQVATGHPAGEHAADGHPGVDGRPVTALRGPSAPAPGGTVRRFTLTARTATVTLSSGRRVAAWTFDGQVPGPAITATEGDLIEVRLRNADIEPGVTIHWHGYDVPAGEDGVPGMTQDVVRPGQEFTYRFLADQAGTYWYHTHEVSDRGVRMGLYGTLVVAPRPAPAQGVDRATDGVDLTLPVHTFAGATVLGDQDRTIEQAATPGTPVRLRLINTDNTPHRFTLAGTPYRLVAVDGQDLNGPGELDRAGLRLPAGGRYDLAFTMPQDRAVLLNVDDRVSGLRLTPGGAAGTVAAEDTSGWPELDLTRYGTPAATPFGAGSRFDRRFTLVLDRGLALAGGRPMYAYTVNGHAFPSIPTQVVGDGDLVRFTVVNRGRDTHPWHLHGHRVLVLSRDGHAPTGSPLWLDTFDVRPGEVWEVAFRAANPGLWMNHCHDLSHADQGMVLHLAYQGVTTPFHGAHGG